MLRSYSMKTLEVLETIQLFDNLATPTKMPMIVARRMPPAARRIVLTMPAYKARPPVSGSSSIVPLRLIPGSISRKSNPVLMLLASRLSPA